jgi:hypothetical protein
MRAFTLSHSAACSADWSGTRNPPFADNNADNNKETDYAGAGHQAAPCADPVGLQPALRPDLGIPNRFKLTRPKNLELAFRFNRNGSSSAIINSFDLAQHGARHATVPR